MEIQSPPAGEGSFVDTGIDTTIKKEKQSKNEVLLCNPSSFSFHRLPSKPLGYGSTTRMIQVYEQAALAPG